ncbi:MAG: hypothetical protein Q9227_001741 [Pyrenula ochraceoflavens]
MDNADFGRKITYVRRGIAQIAPVRSNDRTRANFRYYCDNDEVIRTHGIDPRWTIRPDPPLKSRPPGYVKQEDRLEYWDPLRRPDDVFREYEDTDNGILRGTASCDLPGTNVDMVLHTIKKPYWPQRIWQPSNRATITVSRQRSRRGSAVDTETFALGWHDVQRLLPDEKIANPANYVYFSLVFPVQEQALDQIADLSWQLARLADQDWAYRLGQDAYNGVLVWDRRLVNPFA